MVVDTPPLTRLHRTQSPCSSSVSNSTDHVSTVFRTPNTNNLTSCLPMNLKNPMKYEMKQVVQSNCINSSRALTLHTLLQCLDQNTEARSYVFILLFKNISSQKENETKHVYHLSCDSLRFIGKVNFKMDNFITK